AGPELADHQDQVAGLQVGGEAGTRGLRRGRPVGNFTPVAVVHFEPQRIPGAEPARVPHSMSNLSLETREEGGAVRIAVSGELDLASALTFDEELRRAE